MNCLPISVTAKIPTTQAILNMVLKRFMQAIVNKTGIATTGKYFINPLAEPKSRIKMMKNSVKKTIPTMA